MPKTAYVKTKALCADGVIRNVYSQLSARAYDRALIEKQHVGHVKIGMASVSGVVHLTDTPLADKSGQLFTQNIFEAYPEGRNANLIAGCWAAIDEINMEEKAQELLTNG